MNNIDNLESYADVENLSRFTKESFEEYCKLKLETCKQDVEFILKNVYQEKKLSVCEIGGGNGKLLYSLEKEGILEKGYNYEVSESRWKFAEKFKEWMHSEKVINKNQDILTVEDLNEKFDCIIAVDIVTQIITNLYDEAEEQYFTWINQHLKMGGTVFFELQSFTKEINYIIKEKEAYKWWEEFPEDDPFQYGLYSLDLDQDENIVYKKLFYERKTGNIEGFKDVIKPYQENEIIEILYKYGMKGEIYHCYKEDGDLPKKLYLVLAKKINEVG